MKKQYHDPGDLVNTLYIKPDELNLAYEILEKYDYKIVIDPVDEHYEYRVWSESNSGGYWLKTREPVFQLLESGEPTRTLWRGIRALSSIPRTRENADICYFERPSESLSWRPLRLSSSQIVLKDCIYDVVSGDRIDTSSEVIYGPILDWTYDELFNIGVESSADAWLESWLKEWFPIGEHAEEFLGVISHLLTPHNPLGKHIVLQGGDYTDISNAFKFLGRSLSRNGRSIWDFQFITRNSGKATCSLFVGSLFAIELGWSFPIHIKRREFLRKWLDEPIVSKKTGAVYSLRPVQVILEMSDISSAKELPKEKHLYKILYPKPGGALPRPEKGRRKMRFEEYTKEDERVLVRRLIQALKNNEGIDNHD